MTELKPCAYCGHEAMHLELVGMHNIKCPCGDCVANNDLWWETEQDAIEAWNQRYEPTCHLQLTNIADIVCSECGEGMMTTWAFCPSCGRKVVDE